MLLNGILILASSSILLLLLKQHIRAGLYWILLTLPLYVIRIRLGPVPTTLLEIHILILFAWWITSYRRETKLSLLCFLKAAFEKLQGWRILIFSWAGIATLAMLLSPNLRAAAGEWKAFFIEPLLFFILFVDIMPRTQLPSVFSTILFSGTAIAAWGIIQKFTGVGISNLFWQAEETRRVTSIFPFPNAVGLYLAPIAIMAFIFAVSKLSRSWISKNPQSEILDSQPTQNSKSQNLKPLGILKFDRWVVLKMWKLTIRIYRPDKKTVLISLAYISSAFGMITAMVFARSRGALLGLLVGFVYLALFHRKFRLWSTLAVCGALFVAWLTLGSFIHNPSTFAQGDSNVIRTELWKETTNLLNDYPLFGSGLAGFQNALAPYHPMPAVEIYKYPHNIFLNFWAELGIFGALIFVLIIYCFYAQGFRLLRMNDQSLGTPNTELSTKGIASLTVAILTSMTVMIAHGMVDVPYFKNDLSIFFWVLIGILIVLGKPDTNEAMEKQTR